MNRIKHIFTSQWVDSVIAFLITLGIAVGFQPAQAQNLPEMKKNGNAAGDGPLQRIS